MSDRLDDIAAELDQVRRDRARASARAEDARRAAAEAAGRLPALEAEVDAAEAALGVAREDFEAKRRAFEAASAATAGRRTVADAALGRLTESQEALARAQAGFASARADLEAAETALRTASAALEADLQALAAAQTALDAGQAKLAGLRVQADEIQARLNAAEAAVDAGQREVDASQGAVAAAGDAVSAAGDVLARLTAERDVAWDELQHIRDQLRRDPLPDTSRDDESLEGADLAAPAAGGRRRRVEPLLARHGWLLAELRRLNPLVGGARAEVARLQGDSDQAARRLNTAVRAQAGRNQTRDDARRALEEVAAQVAAATERAGQLTADVQAAEARCAADRDPVAAARREVDAVRTIYTAGRDELRAAEPVELASRQESDAAQRALRDAEEGEQQAGWDARQAEAALAAATADRDRLRGLLEAAAAAAAAAERSAATAAAEVVRLKDREVELRTELAGLIRSPAGGAGYDPPTRPPLLRPVYTIAPPDARLARSVQRALAAFEAEAVSDEADDPLIKLPKDQDGNQITQPGVRPFLDGLGRTSELLRITEELDKGGRLDEVARLILSREAVYTRLLVHAGVKRRRNFSDRVGVIETIAQLVDARLRARLIEKVVTEVFREKQLGPPQNLVATAAQLARGTFPLEEGAVQARVLAGYEGVNRRSRLVEYALLYLRRKGLSADEDPGLVGRMADYLAELRVGEGAGAGTGGSGPRNGHASRNGPLGTLWDEAARNGHDGGDGGDGGDDDQFLADFMAGRYDDLFSLAYENARRAATADGTLVNTLRSGRPLGDWDYSVAQFPHSTDYLRVIPQNILAAGVIDYVYWYGEAMGVFRVADAVVLAWAAGRLDVAGGSSDRLYRYFKLRDDRGAPEERASLYKRVLGRGDGKALKRSVSNRHFPGLWQKLMVEAARYISKRERITQIGTDGDRFARTPLSTRAIEQAVVELQHNLTEFATGLAHLQAREMHEQLRDAFGLIADAQILDVLAGGRRRTPWAVIERVTKEEFHSTVNVAALQTIAERGNDIFRWVSRYEPRRTTRPGGLTDDEVAELTDAAEAYIIAQEELSTPDPDDRERAGKPADEDDLAGVGADGETDETDDWTA